MACSVYWLTQRFDEVPESEDWLSDGERLRAAGMRFAKRRNEWLLGRWAAKRIILAFLGIHPNKSDFRILDIRSAADGAPDPFFGHERAPVSLSISHSGGMSLCTVSAPGVALGCDLEQKLKGDIDFFKDYFTSDELAAVRRTPEAERRLMATLIWSAKESALKSMREGLRRDTRSVEVYCASEIQENTWCPLRVRCPDARSTFEGWWQAGEGSVRTITADRPLECPIPII